jgi:hypothetical protein
MASEMPPDAEQPKSLLAQYHKRLMWRLTAWGGAAAISLVAAVIVSQTATGHKRLKIALFGSEYPYQIPASVASTTVPMPPADLIAVKRSTEAMKLTTEAVKRATDQTVARLDAVERNTAETRAETKRLALQVSKFSADSFNVTGRLANIEHQIDGITGSIKKHAEEAAATAVAKAMPPKPAYDKAFDVTAPIISPPATMFPKLSLIVPPAPGSTSSPMTAEASKTADVTKPDVTITSSITTPKNKPKDQSRVASKLEGTAEPEAKQIAKVSPKPQELRAGVAVETKATPETKEQIALEPEADGKPMAKAERKTMQLTPTEKIVTGSVPTRRRASSRHWIPTRGYGVDLGGADSVIVVKAQWAAVKANFGPMLVGMHPIAVRNHRLLTTGKYRLVVGRIRSLAAAERLCKRFARHQLSCQPIEFEDQRVVWR